MRKDLQLFKLKEGSAEWHQFKYNYVGASESGTIIWPDENSTTIELFYSKLGMVEPKQEVGPMFWGKRLEATVARVWQYHDGTEQGYINNFNSKHIVRKCRRIGGVVVHPKYPWLSASLDRLINKNQVSLITGEKIDHECPLEIKTINMMEKKKWEEEVPPRYLCQIMQQMMITEAIYGELALFDNFRDFSIYGVNYDKALGEKLVEQTHDFWFNRVIPARKVLNKVDREVSFETLPPEIQELEPPPDTTEAYKNFWASRMHVEARPIQGTKDVYEIAVNMKFWDAVMKKVEGRKNLSRNQLIEILKNANANTIDFGKDGGKVTWKPQSNTPNLVMRNDIKYKVDQDDISDAILDMLKE